jgi:hypothetical protein
MSWFHFPSRVFYNVGGSLAIFLVKRKLKKNHTDLGKWILLAKLYEVKQERQEAIKTLKLAQRIFPKSELLKSHLSRLQKSRQPSSG